MKIVLLKTNQMIFKILLSSKSKDAYISKTFNEFSSYFNILTMNSFFGVYSVITYILHTIVKLSFSRK